MSASTCRLPIGESEAAVVDQVISTGGTREVFADSRNELVTEHETLLQKIDTRSWSRIKSDARGRYRKLAIAVALTDVFAIVAALLLAWVLRRGVTPLPWDYAALVLSAPFLWLAVFQSYSLYRIQSLAAWDEFRRTLSAASLGMVLIVMASFWSHSSFSRAWVGLTWAFSTVFVLLGRRVWRRYIFHLRMNKGLRLRTLVVGAPGEATQLTESLKQSELGFKPVGYVSTDHSSGSVDGLPHVGRIDDLVEAIYDYGVDCVFVASVNIDETDMLKVTKEARQQGAEVRVLARLPEILSPRLSVQPMGHEMALSLKPVQLTGTQRAIKRGFDLAVSSTGFLLILPFFCLIALAVKLSSPGSVFFRQHRVTKGGHVFTVYKFRTMREVADSYLEQGEGESSAPFFKLKDDPRLTKIGAFLRRLSLDELPQLVNVVKGDMSLVGPRPLPAEQVAANLSLLGPRHEVPAGITGWWQIQGRSDVGPEEALRMDLFYIENWSLALDLFILLKTLGAVIKRTGAY